MRAFKPFGPRPKIESTPLTIYININIYIVLMCLRDARFKDFHTSILGLITSSLFDGLVYFNCYPDITLALDDPNIVKVLTLNILTSGYDMDESSKAPCYHISHLPQESKASSKASLCY